MNAFRLLPDRGCSRTSAVRRFLAEEKIWIVVEGLRRDSESGERYLRHGRLLDRTALDLGYGLVVA